MKLSTKQFNALPKAEKIILIAKDVIKQLNTKKLIANAGSYVNIYNQGLKKDDDIQKNYSKVKECRVCALGACMMSATKFGNILKVKDVGIGTEELDNDNTRKLFNSIFSPKQLLLIETAFESHNLGTRYATDILDDTLELTDSEIDKCNAFYDSYCYDKDRLIAIMENIIRNEGIFRP